VVEVVATVVFVALVCWAAIHELAYLATH